MGRDKATHRLISPVACGFLALVLAGCSARPPADSSRPITQAEAERVVAEHFHLSRYVTNEFIPQPGASSPAPLAPPYHLRVALQWIMTGDVAPWVVAQRKGFFRDLGLDVELIEGGPGREMLGGVLVGRYDIYMGYPEVILNLLASPTGSDMKMICGSMKDSGVGWIGLDQSIPASQHSTRHITANDLRGCRIGVQPGSDFLLDYLCDQTGVARKDMTILNEGATPDPLVAGALDFYEGLRSDQPRLLERAGYHNWTFLPLADYGYSSYLDVSAVTAAFYQKEPHVLACYVFALDRAIRYITAHPDEAAQITVESIPRDAGTVQEMRTRLQREIPLYFGDGSEPPLYLNEAKLQRLLAILYRYHRIELPSETPK